MMKNAFGKKAASGVFGKDFESFMKKALKTLDKCKEVNETFHVKDPVGGYKYSVVFCKKTGLAINSIVLIQVFQISRFYFTWKTPSNKQVHSSLTQLPTNF
jgi:hypothetical protein